VEPGTRARQQAKKKRGKCYNVRRHTRTSVPRVKLLLLRPLIRITILKRMRREGVIGAEEINFTAPMKPVLTSRIGPVGLALPVRRKLLLHPVDDGGQVVAVVEKARQRWRKGSQHLTKRRRGNVPLRPWPIPPGTASVADTVSISARRKVLNSRSTSQALGAHQ
jgi:hypothetical protein